MAKGVPSWKVRKAWKKVKSLRRRLRHLNDWKKSYFTGPQMELGKGLAGPVAMLGLNNATTDPTQLSLRRALAYRGLGDYRDVLKWGSRGIGALAGGATGFMSGSWGGLGSGARSGWDQGASFSKYMGWGDYGPISTNQIIGGSGSDQAQIMVNPGDLTGDIYYSWTEFVGNVTASTGGGVTSTPFQITAYDLNPGMSGTFKWLSQIAQNFELYDWQGLIFQFKPTSGEFGASAVSNALGKVIMATRYGVTQTSGFNNAIEMQNYSYASSCKPSCGMHHGVETANRSQVTGDMNVIRTGPPVESRILYDVGQFYIATEGVPMAASTTAILGELWVSYRVRLSRPKLFTAVGDEILSYYAKGTPIPASIGSAMVPDPSNTLGCTISETSATQFTVNFPVNIFQGTFLINCTLLSAAPQNTTIFSGTVANQVNCSTIADYYDLTVPVLNAPSAVSTTAVSNRNSITFPINVTAPGNLQASFRIGINAAVPVGTHSLYLLITQIDSDTANNSL